MDEPNMIFKATGRLTREHCGSDATMCRTLIHQSLDALESREESVQPSRPGLSTPSPMTFDLVARAVTTNTGANSLCCPECQAPLDLHQPDEEQPAQLLGTCDCCSKWYFLMEIEPDWNGTLLIELPCERTIRAKFAMAAAQ
jgi:hypothetical protein